MVLFPLSFMKLSIQVKSKNILTKIMFSNLFHIFNTMLLLHTNTLKLKLWNISICTWHDYHILKFVKNYTKHLTFIDL
jgi:hypothetical protein